MESRAKAGVAIAAGIAAMAALLKSIPDSKAFWTTEKESVSKNRDLKYKEK